MNKPSAPQFTGRHMLLVMLAFFAVIVAANMTMVYYATHSWSGLVVKNSYVASQEFNSITAKLEQAAAEIQTKVQYSNGKLTLSILDRAGRPVKVSNLTIKLGRPSHESEDKVVTPLVQENGEFVAALALTKGQWSGVVTADVQGQSKWQRSLRLIAKD